MRQFLANKKLIIIFLSVVVSFSLIAFSLFNTDNITPPQQGINDVTGIANRGVSAPSNAIVDFYYTIQDVLNVYDENKALKEQANRLYEIEAELTDVKQENDELKSIVEITKDLSDYQLLNGTVLARGPETWNDQIIIDLGSQAGVKVGMSVISERGLIGRIKEVNPTNSKVSLLTSASQSASRVAAVVQAKDGAFHGVVNSYDPEKMELIMTQVDPNANINAGDKVITSGLGGVTVSTLYIGQVTGTEIDDFGLSKVIRIKPGGDFRDIRYVSVIMSDEFEIIEASSQVSTSQSTESDASSDASSEPQSTEATSASGADNN